MRNLSGYVAAPLLTASLLAVAACGADDAGDDAGEDSSTQEASVEAEETASDEATTEETAGQDADDRTAAGLLAITTAEGETGGSAYAIDYSDDADTWEVALAFGSDGPVEVTVDAAGTAVVGTEAIDELDRDFERALEFALASGTTIGDAIELGVAETGGVLEEAELDDDGDAAWRVSTDVDGQVTDVWLDVFSGEVVPEPADD